MVQKIKELENAILSSKFQDDNDFEDIYTIMENIQSQKNNIEYVEPILNLMRDNPEIYYGTPGPIIQFLEGFIFDNLDVILIKSLDIKITDATLDLFLTLIAQTNINSDKNDNQQRFQNYMEKLKEFLENDDLTDEQMEEIEDFIDLYEDDD